MITRILYFVAVLGALLGLIVLITPIASGTAPEPISVAVAVAYAVIPYCLARAWHEIGRGE